MTHRSLKGIHLSHELAAGKQLWCSQPKQLSMAADEIDEVVVRMRDVMATPCLVLRHVHLSFNAL